jgi:cell division protein FtsQ
MSAPTAAPSKNKLTIISLLICACFLIGRLVYIYLGDPVRFPINTIKVIANYKHMSHGALEAILSQYRETSFFTFPVHQLDNALQQLPWTAEVNIERQWPDTIILTLKEKQAIATWNGEILTDNGDSIQDKNALLESQQLPHLYGPSQNMAQVLATYQQINALLTQNNLKMTTLVQRDNHAWEATLANGIILKLGKQFPLERTARFCKAYPLLIERAQPISSVDLRYTKGLAVKWGTPR